MACIESKSRFLTDKLWYVNIRESYHKVKKSYFEHF